MKSISLSGFVMSQWNEDVSCDEFSRRVVKYASFLRQPLKLGMFKLEAPPYDPTNEQYWAAEWFEYNCTKDMVIFENVSIVPTHRGFYVKIDDFEAAFYSTLEDKTIENLVGYDNVFVKYEI